MGGRAKEEAKEEEKGMEIVSTNKFVDIYNDGIFIIFYQ